MTPRDADLTPVVLLVEDNPDDEEFTLSALRDAGIGAVAVARDGAEALDYLLGRGAHAGRDACSDLRLVLLDLRLPKVGGLEVLRRLRAEERARLLPVVVLTSSSQEEDVVASYELGANSLVRKPVEYHRFADAVRQVGLYWLQLNETPPPAPSRAGR